MWTQITTIQQVQRLQLDSSLLHRPVITDAVSPTPGETHPDLYKLKKFDGEVITLYQSGQNNGRPFYSARGFPLDDILNGHWWIWQL
jgi:hypothetical protein